MIEDTSDPFHLPRRFGPLPGYGGRGIVRCPWKHLAAATAPANGWCSQCVDENPTDGWDEAAAPYILLESEWRIWHRIRRPAARRQWMRGRVAAKDAIRLLLWDRFGILSPLEVICVLPDERGQPHVSRDAQPVTGAKLSVSISHCGNSSVALVAECSESCRGVGIDVALLADDHDGLAEGGFAPSETALLDDCPPPKRAEWLLRLWCAKEAAGKALGSGLQGDPLNFVVHRINRARGTVEVEAHVHRTPLAPPEGPARITAHVGNDRGLVFAVARLEGN